MSEVNVNEQLVKQCLHRYRSLEVEIIDAARSGLVTEARFNECVKRLERVRRNLEAVHSKRETSSHVSPLKFSTIELPVLSDCSRSEQRIIRATLSDNARMLDQIAVDTTKLLSYTRDAHADKFTWITTALRLSWMRSRMLWTTRQLDLVRSMRRVIEDFIAKFSPNKFGTNGQGDLVEAFREFEGATSRIAKLRTRLQIETALNRDQEQWLYSYETRRKEAIEPTPPPVPAELIRARNEVESQISSGAVTARERLVIASDLASSLTQESRSKGKDGVAKAQNLTQITPKQSVQKNNARHRKHSIVKRGAQ